MCQNTGVLKAATAYWFVDYFWSTFVIALPVLPSSSYTHLPRVVLLFLFANLQAQDPTLSVRPMAVGHNRVYYHTRSVQPIRACEFDVDSEAEDAPIWLCQHYQRKVEEFTDVNQVGIKNYGHQQSAIRFPVNDCTCIINLVP